MSLAQFGRPSARNDTVKRAGEWSRSVFSMFGRRCYLCCLRNPRSKVQAVWAAHIVKRSRMGAAIAYGPKDGPVEPRLGRPLCDACHRQQELDLDPNYRFPLADRIQAVLLHNAYSKSALPVPTE